MKGLHLTIDSWRKGRDKEGWPEDGKNNYPDNLDNEEEINNNRLRLRVKHHDDDPAATASNAQQQHFYSSFNTICSKILRFDNIAYN